MIEKVAVEKEAVEKPPQAGHPPGRCVAGSESRRVLDELLELAVQGLAQYYPAGHYYHTARRIGGDAESALRFEGYNLRYAAIVSLGVSCLEATAQRKALGGPTASEFVRKLVAPALASQEMGEIALVAWACAEVAGLGQPELLGKLLQHAGSGDPVDTVVCAWMLCAALASPSSAESQRLRDMTAGRLLSGQESNGLFPHVLPRSALGRLRTHVSCFADQVYPIQALARLTVATQDKRPLQAADHCARRICDLQGAAGQWWWHYDVRSGEVVEGYPVYSVHQHAMGPMALFDLREAGGTDFSQAAARGLDWLFAPPEMRAQLLDRQRHVVWRKIARQEPAKLARKLAALSTAYWPGFSLPGLDLILPPRVVDYECRPYELGWMLYAWKGAGKVQRLHRTV